ncbi:MAG: YybH family protein [Myxococcaceae bacterium]
MFRKSPKPSFGATRRQWPASSAKTPSISPARRRDAWRDAAIQALFQQRLAAARFLDATATANTVGTDGDLAYETGTNKLTRQTGDAAPVTTTGRYLTVWHHDTDGQWCIQVDMVVVDAP